MIIMMNSPELNRSFVSFGLLQREFSPSKHIKLQEKIMQRCISSCIHMQTFTDSFTVQLVVTFEHTPHCKDCAVIIFIYIYICILF